MRAIRPLVLLAAGWITALPLPVSAEIYKCRLADGRVEISDTPCPAGSTISVRRADSVSPEQRANAERELERMRDYVERREKLREQNDNEEPKPARRTEDTPPPPQALVNECLQELERLSLSAGQRAQMDAECRKNGRAFPAAPANASPVVVGDSISRCLRNVELLNLPPHEREFRMRQCQGIAPPVHFIPRPQPPVVPVKPEIRPEPAHALCPPGQPNCGKGPAR